jgi:hypothetical protein
MRGWGHDVRGGGDFQFQLHGEFYKSRRYNDWPKSTANSDWGGIK